MIHPTAEVLATDIGEGTNIWQFCVILPRARIGKRCNICAHVLVENDVTVGDDVTIKSGVQLWDGITVGDRAFLGPNATFTNDFAPRSKSPDWRMRRTSVGEGASIGANATVLCGLRIGDFALIGAGSVVTKDVGCHEVWYGNPARHRGFATRSGILLDMEWRDEDGLKRGKDE